MVDFLHGQEKTSSQKEDCQPEKTNPEKISSQKSAFRPEEDGQTGCAEKACRKKEVVAEEEIAGKKEIGKENHAPPRGRNQSGDSKRPSRSGRGVSRTVRRYARALTQSYDDSESVEELMEEGQYMEAEAVSGVENAPDADQGEVRTRQFPEDDVPEEYQNED